MRRLLLIWLNLALVKEKRLDYFDILAGHVKQVDFENIERLLFGQVHKDTNIDETVDKF